MNKKIDLSVKILGLIFIIISLCSVFFAACSQRGLYLDGAVFFMKILDNYSSGNYTFFQDIYHPRFFVAALQQLPLILAAVVFHIKSKITLATIYSFAMFFFPLLFLWWNYELTKRTKQYAILFWSVFFYACVSLQYHIFAICENIIGVPCQFLLLNYLFGKINYTKLDKIGIGILLLLMFGIYEHTILVGIIMFACMFLTLFDEENSKNLLIKILIGAISLAAAIYTFFFALMCKHEHSDFVRFLVETFDFWNRFFGLNTGLFVLTVFLLLILLIRKNHSFSPKQTILIGFIYLYYFLRMVALPDLYLMPMWEQHTRSIVCWAVPLVFLGLFIYRLKINKPQTDLIKNAYIPVLFCGIFLSLWQIVHTYFWNENIGYMKKELANYDQILYFPEEHEEISGYFNEDLRRYIWNANYSSTALVLTKEYRVKKFLMPYEKSDNNSSNPSLREYLYVLPEKGLISLPYNNKVHIINKYWDLTDCANQINQYNEENNIPTNRADKLIIMK